MLVSSLASVKSSAVWCQAIFLSSEKTTNASCLNARHCRTQPSYILKMKLAGPLVISLLSCSAFAAKKPVASTFETYHARAVASTPILIDDQGYEQVTSAPRDYSVAVLLTALEDKFGCKLCRDFHSEWSVIAHSWQKGDKKGESRTLFATIDFSRGRATFMKV
jgi:oligosaccharyltransferase complex subunit gamma